MGEDRMKHFVDFRMILRTSLVVSCMCELIHCIFNMRWFRKVATVIIFDEIRADEDDIVSEELRKRAAQCSQRSVIRRRYSFYVFAIRSGDEQVDICWKYYVLVQRKGVQNVQERPGIYTGFVKVNIEISKTVKFILKLQSVFKEIWKLIKEHICTSRRAVNAYEIGSDRRMFDKDANCFEAQEFGCMNNFNLESFTH